MSLAVVHSTAPPPPPPRAETRERIAKIIQRLQRQAEDEGELVSRLAEKLKHDAIIRLAAARYLIRAVTTDAEAKQRRRAAAPTPRERIARKAQESAAVTATAAAIKQKLLLDMVCANGKLLRFCVRGDCCGFGGAFTKLAAALPDATTMVGEVLTEGEVRDLFNGSLGREGMKT